MNSVRRNSIFFCFRHHLVKNFQTIRSEEHTSELEDQLVRKRLDYFIGTSGFYRKFQSFGLRSVATLFTEVAPNPRYATGSVFVVRNDSPIKKISDLKGKTALASWAKGFSSFYTPMGEIYKQGFDPESIHITAAISNISFNLPVRKLINYGFCSAQFHILLLSP